MTHERGVAALLRLIRRGVLKVNELKKTAAAIEAQSAPSEESRQTAARIKEALALIEAGPANAKNARNN